jgi:hypothetical protein
MDQLLNNRDDSEEATASFDKAFITLDNSRVSKLWLVSTILEKEKTRLEVRPMYFVQANNQAIFGPGVGMEVSKYTT